MRKLDTPIKRAGFAILLIGVLVLAAGFVDLFDDGSRRLLGRWWSAVLQERPAYRRYWIAAWGTYLVIVGLAFSFAYDAGVGRLVRWIRHGNAPRDR